MTTTSPIHAFLPFQNIQRECWQIADDRGWHDKPATFGDRIALIHSEASEALEAFRTGRPVTDTWYEPETPTKPEGVPSELADVMIRVWDFAEINGIDLIDAIAEKMAYNGTRPYRHGGKEI